MTILETINNNINNTINTITEVTNFTVFIVTVGFYMSKSYITGTPFVGLAH